MPGDPMPAQASRYRFGPYEVRTESRELYKNGTRLKVRPQPFQVLQALVERAGEVVRREELRRILWPSETYVDFERGLNTSIRELRSRLCDSASEPRYIETLPKLGYRLIVPVEAGDPGLTREPAQTRQAPASELHINETYSLGVNPPIQPRRHWLLGAAVLAIVLAAAAGFWQWQHLWARSQPSSERLMLAVLPIENLTGDAGQEYWSDGLTEEMIAQLGRLDPDHLGVIARTSVMRYKNQRERISQIGRELNVQYILEGSVRKESGNVRVSAQLIRVRDESHVWARQYDRQLIGLLALQGEIAREISDEIQLTIGTQRSGPSAARPVLSAEEYEAYDLYLKGLFFWNKRHVNAFRQAIGYFQQAIDKDPKNARSYAGLADCYALLGGYSAEPLPEYMAQARAAALRSLEIDESLPEAHTALALIVQNYDWDWQTTEKEFRRAIQLNPSYATAHQWYAEHLGFRGQFDQAFRESEIARQLDPLSLIIAADNAVLLHYSRQYDRAIEKFCSIMEMDPQFSRAGMVVYPYIETGQAEKALPLVRMWQHARGDQPWFWSILAYVSGRAGKREEARRALEKLKQLYLPERSDPAIFVSAYLGLGDRDKTPSWLEKAYLQHSPSMTTLKVDPAWDPLRGEPRFQILMKRVGLGK